MPIISKAPKVTIWAVIAIALVGSVISFRNNWILPVIAGFGGIVVFWGLWIEKRAGEVLEKMHKESQRVQTIKRVENVGWWILMAGILAEIVTACALATRDVYDEWKNNPLNQPATTVEAVATVEVRGDPPIQNFEFINGTYMDLWATGHDVVLPVFNLVPH
jgi:hypothetical protein